MTPRVRAALATAAWAAFYVLLTNRPEDVQARPTDEARQVIDAEVVSRE